jgi:hypothetical protein
VPAAPPDDGSGACLLCVDAGYDAPLSVRVKGEIDLVCSNVDGCHGEGAGGMGLVPGNEFAPMIGVPSSEMPTLLRVRPGDPKDSYVYRKIACEGGIDGGCMPLGSKENPQLAALFHDWIEAGAPTTP